MVAVAVLDDDPRHRNRTVEQVRAAMPEARVASFSPEDWGRIGCGKFDALFLDLDLGEGAGTGLDVLQKMCKEPSPQVPRVCVYTNSAFSDQLADLGSQARAADGSPLITCLKKSDEEGLPAALRATLAQNVAAPDRLEVLSRLALPPLNRLPFLGTQSRVATIQDTFLTTLREYHECIGTLLSHYQLESWPSWGLAGSNILESLQTLRSLRSRDVCEAPGRYFHFMRSEILFLNPSVLEVPESLFPPKERAQVSLLMQNLNRLYSQVQDEVLKQINCFQTARAGGSLGEEIWRFAKAVDPRAYRHWNVAVPEEVQRMFLADSSTNFRLFLHQLSQAFVGTLNHSSIIYMPPGSLPIMTTRQLAEKTVRETNWGDGFIVTLHRWYQSGDEKRTWGGMMRGMRDTITTLHKEGRIRFSPTGLERSLAQDWGPNPYTNEPHMYSGGCLVFLLRFRTQDQVQLPPTPLERVEIDNIPYGKFRLPVFRVGNESTGYFTALGKVPDNASLCKAEILDVDGEKVIAFAGYSHTGAKTMLCYYLANKHGSDSPEDFMDEVSRRSCRLAIDHGTCEVCTDSFAEHEQALLVFRGLGIPEVVCAPGRFDPVIALDSHHIRFPEL
jgi:hypothetical protein